MKTLEEAFGGSSVASTPYSGAMKLKIFGVGPIVGYRNASGDQRQSIVSLVLQTAQWQLKEYFMMPAN